MNISVQRNTGTNRLEVPYVADVTIPSLKGARQSFRLPIGALYLGMKKTLRIQICGFELQTERFAELSELIERLLRALINSSRLPTYVFIARHAGIVYPVYTVDNEVFAVTPQSGPVLRHVELAKVREYLTDYLHDIKVLGTDGQRDKLHVRGVIQHNLQLRRPVFYLKKRLIDETEFWAPVFESGDGRRIYAYAVNQRREVPLNDGLEILALRDIVAHFLIQDGRLKQYCDLRPDRLFPDGWRALKRHLEPEAPSIHYHGQALPVFKTPRALWLSAELRPHEERYNLYLGETRAALEAQIEANFARRGL